MSRMEKENASLQCRQQNGEIVISQKLSNITQNDPWRTKNERTQQDTTWSGKMKTAKNPKEKIEKQKEAKTMPPSRNAKKRPREWILTPWETKDRVKAGGPHPVKKREGEEKWKEIIPTCPPVGWKEVIQEAVKLPPAQPKAKGMKMFVGKPPKEKEPQKESHPIQVQIGNLSKRQKTMGT